MAGTTGSVPLWVRGLVCGLFVAALWGAFWPGWGWLAWPAPAFFFFALKGSGVRRGLALGLPAGFLFFLAELSPVLALWPFLGALSVPAWLLLSLYGCLFFAVLGGIVGGCSSPLAWAGGWALLEAARLAGPLGFAFGSLPVALASTPVVGAAAWGGAGLLSLAGAWAGAWVARFPRRIGSWALALLGPVLLVSLALFSPAGEEGRLKVALLQPGFSQEEKLERENLPRLVAGYRELLSRLPQGVELVAIPENALPAFLLEEPRYLEPFSRAARELACPVLLGTGIRRGGKVYNSALLIGPAGEVEGAYDMVHLVPFGEYLPGRSLLVALGLGELLSRLLPYDLVAGEGPLSLGELGVMICFESQFPGIARGLAAGGARVLIALTNDAWFGRARILWEHFAMGALRAAECGRAFLQAAQTGFTGGFDARGRQLGLLPAWEAGTLVLEVPVCGGRTPYLRFGGAPVLALAGLCLLLGVPKKTAPP